MTRTASQTAPTFGQDPNENGPAAIVRFEGQFAFLSNFAPSPLTYEGISYPTVEHAFQAAKTLDLDKRSRMARLTSPAVAKKEGRRLELRPDWDDVRIGVMLNLLRLKFALDSALAEQLMQTGGALLVEGNHWGDRFWGVDGHGENNLGRLLMQVRSELNLLNVNLDLAAP
jgi:ribA/ribD-fused uncharacterized protein